jgi:hypothetical protein
VKGVAVVGWGSLLWSPRTLARAGAWSLDGPTLPIEFSRVSSDGRLTLVVDPTHGADCLTWVCPSPLSLAEAVDDLAHREGCDPRLIGRVDVGGGADGNGLDPVRDGIRRWGADRGFAGVVWTALPSTFRERVGEAFSVESAIGYLDSLTGTTRERAFEYLRRAPETTSTPVRRAFQARWPEPGSR